MIQEEQMNYKDDENYLGKHRAKQDSSRSKRMHAKCASHAQYLRAANEDDDGYDPYSDRPARTPLFEENPWD